MSSLQSVGFNDNDILLAKLTKIVHYCGARILNFLAMDLYRLHPKSDNGATIIDDFCKILTTKNVKKCTGRKLPLNFRFEYNEIQREEFKLKKLLDISSCCIVTDLCKINNDFREKDKYIFDIIELIKKIRNKLCHDYRLETEVIEAYKCDMINHIKNVGVCMEDLLQARNITPNQIIYKLLAEKEIQDINYIWNTPIINAAALKDYKRLPTIENNWKSLIMQVRNELKEKYQPFIQARSISFDKSFSNFSIEDVFSPVVMQVEGRKIRYEEILTFKSLKKDTAPPAVVICGHAGSGKTTLCKKLISDWCTDASQLSQDYELILLFEVKRAKENGIIDYLNKVLLPDTFHKRKAEEIFDFLRQTNVLFVIDGYDERSKEASKIVSELLEKLNDKKFIITTRPHSAKDVFSALESENMIYLNIGLEGFEEEEWKEFINKIWKLLLKEKEVEGNADNLISILKSSDIIYELLKVPLISVMLIYLYMKGKLQSYFEVSTRTIIYKQVFELITNEVVSKIKMQIGDKKSAEALTKDVKDLTSLFAEQCFRLSKNDTYIIDSEMISRVEDKLKERDLMECISTILSSYFHCTPSIRRKRNNIRMKVGEMASEYEFLHKTQMEYLIAYHYVHSVTNTTVEIDELIENKRDLAYDVLPFVVGQLNICKRLNEELVQSIFNIFKGNMGSIYFPFSWNLLSEARCINNDHFVNDQFNPIIFADLKSTLTTPNSWKLNAKNVVSGLQLLKVIEIKSLEITINEDYDAYDIPLLSKVWHDMTGKLGRICIPKLPGRRNLSKFNKLELELHFKSHTVKGERTSDYFLVNLATWSVLKKFSGHLGAEGVDSLLPCSSLRDIHARFTSVDAFNKFNNFCKKQRTLKNVHLTLDFNPDDSNANPSLFKKHTIPFFTSITFYGLDATHLDWAAEVLKNIHNPMNCIEKAHLLKTNLTPEEFRMQFLTKVKDFIHIFKVQSTELMNEKEHLEIYKLSPVDWI